MKHALIVANPEVESFSLTLAHEYAALVQSLGDTALLRDLYRLGFDPRMQPGERPDRRDFTVPPEVVAERSAIASADVFVLIYPLWFGMPPAMLKGYIDRVFTAGFGYERLEAAGRGPLLNGRKLLSVTTSGATSAWLDEKGALTSLRYVFDDYLARICGMDVLGHLHIPSITDGLAQRWIDEEVAKFRRKVKELIVPVRRKSAPTDPKVE